MGEVWGLFVFILFYILTRVLYFSTKLLYLSDPTVITDSKGAAFSPKFLMLKWDNDLQRSFLANFKIAYDLEKGGLLFKGCQKNKSSLISKFIKCRTCSFNHILTNSFSPAPNSHLFALVAKFRTKISVLLHKTVLVQGIKREIVCVMMCAKRGLSKARAVRVSKPTLELNLSFYSPLSDQMTQSIHLTHTHTCTWQCNYTHSCQYYSSPQGAIIDKL